MPTQGTVPPENEEEYYTDQKPAASLRSLCAGVLDRLDPKEGESMQAAEHVPKSMQEGEPPGYKGMCDFPPERTVQPCSTSHTPLSELSNYERHALPTVGARRKHDKSTPACECMSPGGGCLKVNKSPPACGHMHELRWWVLEKSTPAFKHMSTPSLMPYNTCPSTTLHPSMQPCRSARKMLGRRGQTTHLAHVVAVTHTTHTSHASRTSRVHSHKFTCTCYT
mmetsp:Transcript_18521/g.52007  ORF Transcript_18521/g.52007 Transcript_18521/m.52007 type:complete len:223 (-) Transcript_18521:5186-5854(-)|eukprot:1153433-Pelagomonas_calceolata.AAC.3